MSVLLLLLWINGIVPFLHNGPSLKSKKAAFSIPNKFKSIHGSLTGQVHSEVLTHKNTPLLSNRSLISKYVLLQQGKKKKNQLSSLSLCACVCVYMCVFEQLMCKSLSKHYASMLLRCVEKIWRFHFIAGKKNVFWKLNGT